MNNRCTPGHVAIVMDGNGRWAKQHGVNRIDGHRKGAEVALDIVKHAAERGIKQLTLYTFSSENWGRPREEVQGLMEILYENLLKEADALVRNGVKLSTIGAFDRLPPKVKQALIDVREATSHCDKLILTLAISYGSRDEIVRACKKMLDAIKNGNLQESDLNEANFASFLDTYGFPDPEMLIRTGGEHRLSNFLLWQCSYAELFFTTILWPDFCRTDFDQMLSDFSLRERRYGRVSNDPG